MLPLLFWAADLSASSGGSIAAPVSQYMRPIVRSADEATFKANVNLEIGTDVQAADVDLTTWAGLTPSVFFQTLPALADANSLRPALSLGWINVKDYPYLAKGDGVTDDTEAIQAAIDAASSAGGGVVYVPGGTYMIGPSTSAITLADGVTLRGDGPGVTRLVRAVSLVAGHAVPVIQGGGKFQVRIRDLAIDGNGDAQTWEGTGIGIWLADANDVIVDNCYITNTKHAGIYTRDTARNIRIQNCTFDRIDEEKPAVYLTAIDGTTHGIVVQGCHFYNCDTGISTRSGADPNHKLFNFRFIDNTFRHCGRSISFSNHEDLVIANNSFYNDGTVRATTEPFIFASNPSTNVVIAGNSIVGYISAGVDGILLANGITRVAVTGNTFRTLKGGVRITSAGTGHITVTGNTFAECDDGIEAQSGTGADYATNLSIIGNTLYHANIKVGRVTAGVIAGNQIIKTGGATSTGLYVGPEATVQIGQNYVSGWQYNYDYGIWRHSNQTPIWDWSSASTSSVANSVLLRHTTSGQMVDGFGAQLGLQARDADGVNNTLGAVGAIRDGADNTGRLRLSAYQAGAQVPVMDFLPTGVASAYYLTMQGIARNDYVLWLKMDDNAASTAVVDSGPYAYTATSARNTNLMATAGKVGGALDFNGVSDTVSIGDAVPLRLTGGGTIAAWVKLTTNGTWRIVDKTVGSATRRGYALGLGGPAAPNCLFFLGVGPSDDTSQLTYSLTTGTPGNWYHVVGVIADNGACRIWVNGADNTNVSKTGLPDNQEDQVFIGSYNGALSFFDGIIDDVRIFNRALTAVEIGALYAGGAGTADETYGALTVGGSDLGEAVTDLWTLAGVTDPNLGTFTGTTIPDSNSIKQGLQALETAVETKLSTVVAANMADADHGDVAWASGVATVKGTAVDAVTSAMIGDYQAVRLLGVADANMTNGAAKTTVYTVPAGKSAIVTMVIIRNPTASLAAGVDYDLGDGANADTWKTTIDLSTMTATTDCIIIQPPTAKFTVFDATDAFGIKPATGSTATASATVMVYGIEF